MDFDERALPLTRGQLDIWLAQETGGSETEWQLSQFVIIEGAVDPESLEYAIRQVVQEAEPIRATFFEAHGRVFQRAIDYLSVELPFHDLRHYPDPVLESYEIAWSMLREPMPFTGPLVKFALMQTRLDEFYLFVCCHHIVVDGFGLALIGNRIADIYSSVISGATIAPHSFGSLRDLVCRELEYEASSDYVEDRGYWVRNLPSESASHYLLPLDHIERFPGAASAPVQLDPVILGRLQRLSQDLNIRRSSVITAACALLVCGCTSASEVVLDFPVSRRTRPESKTFPGMFAGVVPLALRAPPVCEIGDFCKYVDARIQGTLRHQRFPVKVLVDEGHLRGARQAPNRVMVNLFPPSTIRSFGDAAASAVYTTFGRVGHFGLFFMSADGRVSLSSAGVGQPFSNFEVVDLVGRLERLLGAMLADPARALSSIDLLDEQEHTHLDTVGNRAALTDTMAAVSIPELFAAQVARTPAAVALVCGERSWTYREVEQAANGLAHLLAGHGVGPGDVVALVLPRCSAGHHRDCRGAENRGGLPADGS